MEKLYLYAKVKWCQNTQLVMISMKVESNDFLEFQGADVIIAMLIWTRYSWHKQGTQKPKSEHTGECQKI
jgi:hypothetical protein